MDAPQASRARAAEPLTARAPTVPEKRVALSISDVYFRFSFGRREGRPQTW